MTSLRAEKEMSRQDLASRGGLESLSRASSKGAPPALGLGAFDTKGGNTTKRRNETLLNPLKTINSAKSLIQQPQ
jgi:hypothetical protein